MKQFAFAIDGRYTPVLLAWGVTKGSAWLRIDDDMLEARFGLFKVSTPVSNINGYQLSGDYKAYRAIGVRGSLVDKGITFGSNTHRGLCMTFDEPIAVKPGVGQKHPGLTVTVEDVDGLAAELDERGIPRTDA